MVEKKDDRFLYHVLADRASPSGERCVKSIGSIRSVIIGENVIPYRFCYGVFM